MPSREELWDLLRAKGAETRDSVTKQTTMLLVGEGYGRTKLEKAIKYGCPTLSLPMAEYLGVFQKLGSFKIDPQLKSVMPQVYTTYLFVCEITYAKFIRSHGRGEPEAELWLGAFYGLAAGLSELLRITWGDPGGGGSGTHEDLSELVSEFERLRTTLGSSDDFRRECMGNFDR